MVLQHLAIILLSYLSIVAADAVGSDQQCAGEGDTRKLEVIVETPFNSTNSYSLVGAQVRVGKGWTLEGDKLK
jgi:hypothetical protein